MVRYLLQRMIAFVPTLIGVSILIFAAIRLIPGDAITAQLGTEAGMLTEAQRAALARYYGLDVPPVQQYFTWLGEALRGNLGFSIRHGKPVTELLAGAFPLTLQLALMAVVIALLIGIPLGLVSAVSRSATLSLFSRIFSLLGLALPSFLVGTLIIYFLSVVFRILPNAGNYVSFFEDPMRNLSQMIFPAITLGFSFSAAVMRTTRSAMLEVLGEDYIRTARSKGLRERAVTLRHALRNALIPVVTLVGIQMGYLLGGTFIVEQIFALPGLGRLTVNAISQREYALVQGATLFIALNFVAINLLVDLVYAAIDPRVSYGRRN